MNVVKDFFIELGFVFGKTLASPDNNFLTGETSLKERLDDVVFYFESPNQTNTSFYLITVPLPDTDFDLLRRYIWNENKADLLFYVYDKDTDFVINLAYSKASPNIDINNCKLDTFKPNNEDIEKLKAISSWQFESGSFWLNYNEFLNKSILKSIDRELVDVLNTLRSKLHIAIQRIEISVNMCNEIVQALIDRTLYIKYLEDNHIINSYFYSYYFQKPDVNFKVLLSNPNPQELNRLFSIIHSIFNNCLFSEPNISEEYLTMEVCGLILHTLSGTNLTNSQLRLFDFKFDVIPVEFISYIYEIFLSEKNKSNGIYYTPKKLAQLIIDDVITEKRVGRVLDPSCGSGMFLIVAFQNLIENSNEQNFIDIEKRIEHRTKLLSNNIFGIEKEITAQRFTIFSLSLQLFRGLDPYQIKEYIANQLREKGTVDLFVKFDLSKNIVCANTLNIETIPFDGETFDFIVGNPPFFEVKTGPEFKHEINFINFYERDVDGGSMKAKDIVKNHQISQCFLLKVMDWSNQYTRFGFVSNSSNFYDDNSISFQKYFYHNYNIEKIYELSQVKKILFEKAKESVVALIFSNQIKENNNIDYYSVEMGIFSEKPFELLVIQEDKNIELNQLDLIQGKIKLRDYLVGNWFDIQLINNIRSNSISIDNFIKRTPDKKIYIHTGLQIAGVDVILKSENITREEYELNKKQYLDEYTKKYTRQKKDNLYRTPLIKAENIKPFSTKGTFLYANETSNFRRKGYSEDIYLGEKILWVRIGKYLQAFFSTEKTYFDFDIHVVKLADPKYYYLFTAILNSQLVNYYINMSLRKRLFDFHSKIDKKDFCKIPIPENLDNDIAENISAISKCISYNLIQYDDSCSAELNDLIFDLYELGYLEKQRIKDYFLKSAKISKTGNELIRYKETLIDIISMYFEDDIEIEFSSQNFNPVVAKIYFKKSKHSTPSADKTAYYLLNEIFEHNPNENFLASQEKIYGNESVYIVKNNCNINWTETKAFEDAQDILKHVMNNG